MSPQLNAKTDYQFALQPWNELAKVKTRIRVAKKPSRDAGLLTAIEAWAHAQGVSLTADQRAAAVAAVQATLASRVSV